MTDHVQAMSVFGLTWLASDAALWVVPHVVSHPSGVENTLAIALAMALSTLVRFVAMDRWIFRGRVPS